MYFQADVWLCFWFCYPVPTHHIHHGGGGCSCSTCIPCCIPCNCNNNCNDCNSNGGGGYIILILILILAIIGLIFSIIILVSLFTQMYFRHQQLVVKYNNSLLHRVKDLSDESKELFNARTVSLNYMV